MPSLWGLFSGENEKLNDDQPCVIPKPIRECIGREMKAGRKTIPLSQARSLRDIHKRSGSYQAVDWMHFLSCTGEAVLGDRIPENIFKMFMLLCRADLLIFKPDVLTEAELREVDKLLRLIRRYLYKNV